jgi:uncharacterized repeat protein (TIGR01451 family)
MLGLSMEAWPADHSTKAAPEIARSLAGGAAQDLIVEFDDTDVRQWGRDAVRQRHLAHEDTTIIGEKATRYRALKQRVYSGAGIGAADVLRHYEHLPMAFVHIRSAAVLERLLARGDVTGVYADRRKFLTLDATSAALVSQPVAASLGFTGSGSTVLLIDSGVNYALPDFGACTAPGMPAACSVVWYEDLTGTAVKLDDDGHGTHMAGIIVGIAPAARIAAANVFGSEQSTSDSLILQAINWGIANRTTYNIRAINMSLGDSSRNTAPCQAGNPYYSVVQTALNAGIVTVSSSGNDAYLNAVSNPACTPNVVAVGAVYSTNWGGLSWTGCTDSATAADKVTCFSNSATFLKMLAPGALITAGGLQGGGTSQASAFVAGAMAVLRSAFPTETPAQAIAHLAAAGAPVSDARNGIVTPRLNLGAAVRPINDLFVNRIGLSGNSGAASGSSNNATREAGEPNHAGNPGGASVWWKWSAPASGQFSVNTAGSSFTTLLAVYTGTSVGSLTPVASTTNGVTGVLLQAQQGAEYEIAVDGNNGATGSIALNWSLNTTAAADLAITVGTANGTIATGGQVIYTLTVRNNGPQTATGAKVTDTLPAALTYVSATSGCMGSGAVVTCNLGNVTTGNTATASITARANVAGNVVNAASVASSVPDPVASNNSDSVSITVAAAAGGSNEVPTLPQWAAIVLAVILAGTIHLGGDARSSRMRPPRSGDSSGISG